MRFKTFVVLAACLAACSSATKTDQSGGNAAEVGTRAESSVGASGGSLATPGSTASVVVPAGALAADVKLSVTVLSPSSVAAPSAGKQPSTSIESNVYDFGPSGTQFSQPVTLAIKSGKAAVAGSRHVLAVLDANSVWQALAGSTEINGTVSASTTHFSQYCVLSVPTSGAGCAWQSDPNYCAPLVCDPAADFAGICAAPAGAPLPTGGAASQLAFSAPPPSTVTAGDTFSFTVAVEDANGVVTDSNAPVAFSLVQQGSQPYFGQAVAAVHGYARPLGGGYGLRKAGTYVIDAQSPNLTSPASAVLQVAVGPASPNTTTIVASPASAAVNANVTLTLTATDAADNVIPGAAVAWTASGAGSHVSPSNSTTDDSGQATATLSASSAGTASARAAVGSASFLVTVQFHGATQGTSGNSSLFPVNGTTTADGVHEIRLQGSVLDSSGQPVSGHVTYTVQGQGTTVHGGDSLDANGQMSPTVTSEVGGLKVITANVGGQQLKTSIFFSPSQCAAPLSQPVQPVLDAVSPGHMAYADLNGDGADDLVATNGFFSGTVSVFLADGHGGFGAHREYDTADQPGSVAVGDVDRDHKVDVVVSSNSHGISVLLGNGDGTFQAATSESAFDSLGDMALADLNQDGKLDIVAVASNGVQIRFGNGDGTFQNQSSYNLGSNLGRLALGDFDGDRWLDVAVASQTKVSFALYNSTNAALGASTDVPVTVTDSGTVFTTGLAAGDVNGDGIDDLAVAFTDTVTTVPPGPSSPTGAYHQTFVVRPFIGSSAGFQAGTDFTRSVAGAALLQDINGDSKLDLITPSGDRVGIALGDSTGAFVAQDDARTGNDAEAVLLLDYNNDGSKDLVVGNGYSHYVSLLPGVGDGTFPALPAPQSVGHQPRIVLTADLNGDAAVDAVLVNQGGLTALLNDGHGRLQSGHDYSAAANANITGAVLADVTGDGVTDVVVASNAVAGTVQVFSGAGDGTFRAVVSYAAGGGTQSVAVGDVNGDDAADVVAANYADGTIAVLPGAADGTLGAAVSYPAGSAPQNVVLGNLDRDFTLDAVVSNGSGSTVSVLLNSSSGFAPAATPSVGSHPGFVAVNDINADYIPDLIVTNSADGSVSLLVNDGNGLFANPNNLSPNVNAAGMSVVDLNADANSEIILAPGSGGRPLVMYASGYRGYFTTQATYGGPSGVLGFGDISGDGYPDFIVVDATGGLTVLPSAGCSHVSKVGLADYAQSRITASPNAVVADGSATAVVSGRIVDLAGHPIAGQTLSLTANGGFGGSGGGSPIHLSPNPFTTDSNGTFSVSITSTTAGQYYLQLYQQPINNYVWSGSVAFSAGPDAALQFLQPPFQAQSGQALRNALNVQVVDAHGNATTSSASVTLSVDSAHGASLGGTLTGQASYGTASFPGITVNATSNGNVVLRAQSTGLTDATATVGVYVGLQRSLQLSVPNRTSAGQPFKVQATALESSQSATTPSESLDISVFDGEQAAIVAPKPCSMHDDACALPLQLAPSGAHTVHVADLHGVAADQAIHVQ